ncbi:hypothetical protein LQR30_11715 [Chromobacterium piscinae]|uniref:hypothetical protein n=1 Tax=Chromobacterium piscinae TaxID=686831 RepID=UPI001E4B08EB|nr:hypothetical protein [Chromobacterium piscinae]MCD4504772.1 hypothetical protein [Chromobacterium piscinae]
MDPFILAILGAIMAELLEYRYTKRNHIPFDLLYAIFITLFSGLISSLYFNTFDAQINKLTPFQYGTFLAFAFNTLMQLLSHTAQKIITCIYQYKAQVRVIYVQEQKQESTNIDLQPSLPTSASLSHSVAASVTAGASPLIVSGWLPMFLCGSLGSLIWAFFSPPTGKMLARLPRNPALRTTLIAITGGVYVILLGANNVSALMAIQIGASAPMMLKRLSNNETLLQ